MLHTSLGIWAKPRLMSEGGADALLIFSEQFPDATIFMLDYFVGWVVISLREFAAEDLVEHGYFTAWMPAPPVETLHSKGLH